MKRVEMYHEPVLLHEVINALQPRPDGVYVDCTIGDGGHAAAILEASGPGGTIFGLDADPKQVAVAKQRLERFGPRVVIVRGSFGRVEELVSSHHHGGVDGIVFDLGFSSRQMDDPSYGLSFDDETPLDMRLGPDARFTAGQWLASANEVEIADTLYRYGDRRASRALARKIVAWRRKKSIATAQDLKDALGIDRPASLAPIWQALRIVVNDEFDQLRRGLTGALTLLKPGARLVVITFHSGEDRIVKQFGRANQSLLTEWKLIRPTLGEIKSNRRARSAKLRVFEKKEDG